MKLGATTPVNFLLFLKYFIFYLFRFKIGNYSKPNRNIKDVGAFDKNGNILIDDEHNIKLFDELNVSIIYKKSTKQYKGNKVRVKCCENNIMVCKMFGNDLRQKIDFYRELENLNRVEVLNISPKICFVDYLNYTIYMSLVEGSLLKNELSTTSLLSRSKVRNELTKNLKRIHDLDLILPDLSGSNIVISENEVVFIDFQDAVLLKYFPKQIKRYFRKKDNKKIQYLISKLNENFTN